MKTFAKTAAAVLVVTLIAVPMFAARGSAVFTRFVAIGDSYGAGIQSGSLNERHQPFNWPSVVARQVGAPDFQQPIVSFPGIGPELQLVNATTFPPVITPAAGQGTPINLNLPRPYNNLSIPGANVTDVTTLTGKEAPTSTAKTFAQFILRGLGTEVQQAIAQQPTFIAIWIGGNDGLGAVLGGTPALLTPVDTFRTSYNKMLDDLIAGAPNAGMVVGNLPNNISSIPFTTTVAPVIVNPATRQPVLGPDGNPIFLFADLGGGTLGQLPPGSRVLLSASTDLGQGFGIPPTLKNVPPFNALPHAGEPLPDRDVLTPTEIAAIQTRADEFNAVITASASARNIPVADVKGLFDRVRTGQQFVGPFAVKSDFITGGMFSLDGFHASDLGYILFANE
ncbi:MAG TPA: SGNH/GDSL hydrolase family protein, partial [Thermoanaerobaculia bacterium]|nr:SGNH/GDSL hydrolase family protein [Thermoanaerobaculia bacterium]